MNRLTQAFLGALLAFSANVALAGAALIEYGEAHKFDVCLFDQATGIALEADKATLSIADAEIIVVQDGTEGTGETDRLIDNGSCYTYELLATETDTPRVQVIFADSGTVWLPASFEFETYGHTSAAHPTLGGLRDGLPSAVFTLSGYNASPSSGCTGAEFTLPAGASAENNFYNGWWMVPIGNTGATQGGRWVSDRNPYDGTTKVGCVDIPFVTALNNTTGVIMYNTYAYSQTELNVSGGVVEASLPTATLATIRDLVIEDQGSGVSLGCAIAVVLAYVAGDLVTTAGDSVYEEPSGNETRITGTVTSPGNRTGTIACPTYP
jgi:hypothetical protein